MTVDDVYLSFLPLAHILDRTIEEYFFRNGASVGYYHGVCIPWNLFISDNLSADIGSLMLYFLIRNNVFKSLWFFFFSVISCMKDLNAIRDDLMELKPTLFAGVPRVFEKVYEGKIM